MSMWIRWRYTADQDWQKRRVDEDDGTGAQAIALLDRCAKEFSAPLTQLQQAERNARYDAIMKARRVGA